MIDLAEESLDTLGEQLNIGKYQGTVTLNWPISRIHEFSGKTS